MKPLEIARALVISWCSVYSVEAVEANDPSVHCT